MEGGAISPTGMFLIVSAFTCDMISFFIPFVGPIISTIIFGTLLFIFKDQLGSKKTGEAEEKKGDDKEKKPEGYEDEESRKNREEFEAKMEKKAEDPKASQETKDGAERIKVDRDKKENPKKELPTTNIKTGSPKNTKGSIAADLVRGDIKGIGKKLLINFLINLIPIIGPPAASKTYFIVKIVLK